MMLVVVLTREYMNGERVMLVRRELEVDTCMNGEGAAVMAVMV